MEHLGLMSLFDSKPCCGGFSITGPSTSERVLQILDKICRVALAVFAFTISPYLFTCAFSAGAVLALLYVADTNGGDQNFGTLKPVCGQGYMEFLSGRTWPAWTVHVVTTAFIGAHVRHDPVFFVPFCGLFVGWWAGSEVGAATWNVGQRVIQRL